VFVASKAIALQISRLMTLNDNHVLFKALIYSTCSAIDQEIERGLSDD